jgi:hypothetical protein
VLCARKTKSTACSEEAKREFLTRSDCIQSKPVLLVLLHFANTAGGKARVVLHHFFNLPIIAVKVGFVVCVGATANPQIDDACF